MQIVKPESVSLSSVRLERLTKVMQQYVDRGTFAGIVRLIARRGRVAHLQASGWQDLASKPPMSVSIHALFHHPDRRGFCPVGLPGAEMSLLQWMINLPSNRSR